MHESLNQKGQRYNLDHYVVGAKVYFYRPPSVLDVTKRTRKAKHIDHYVGAATIIRKILGSRSFQLSFVNPSTGATQLLQRCRDDPPQEGVASSLAGSGRVEASAGKTSSWHEAERGRNGHLDGLLRRQGLVCRRNMLSPE
jgi:hypothetical protein